MFFIHQPAQGTTKDLQRGTLRALLFEASLLGGRFQSQTRVKGLKPRTCLTGATKHRPLWGGIAIVS